jgi:hypothetical protein
MLAAAFFSCLSMTIAGVVLRQDRLMGIGQMITMPLFLASNALGPVSIMGRWLRDLSRINPLSYEVDGLRGMLVHSNANIGLDVRRRPQPGSYTMNRGRYSEMIRAWLGTPCPGVSVRSG